MTTTNGRKAEGFDLRAAVTRSLLGWGVVAGPFYLIVAVVHAALKPGFDFSRHALSLLMLTDTGWIQTANLILTGLMIIAAAVGFARAVTPNTRAGWVGALLGIYGLCLVGSGIFPPDPMAGFPPGSSSGDGSLSALLHLAFGAIGFLTLGIAAFIVAAWARSRGSRTAFVLSIVSGVAIVAGFVGGAALSSSPLGVLFLWISVVAGFAWLLGASLYAYRTVPHPDAHRR
ncbi:DUF998 domain-containing protein [Agromyces humatus]|uniref:DUF998 domain-containing protein n=1 Tax=Agromyces humatus TaxID=279573 RepID=A0ABP4XAF5_9MICO|nr:DUF998 domain-containing protein [Agromyces humatus]